MPKAAWQSLVLSACQLPFNSSPSMPHFIPHAGHACSHSLSLLTASLSPPFMFHTVMILQLLDSHVCLCAPRPNPSFLNTIQSSIHLISPHSFFVKHHSHSSIHHHLQPQVSICKSKLLLIVGTIIFIIIAISHLFSQHFHCLSTSKGSFSSFLATFTALSFSHKSHTLPNSFTRVDSFSSDQLLVQNPLPVKAG